LRRTINAGGLNADEVLAQELKVAFGPPSSGGTVISPESQESRISERTGQVHVALFVCLLALLGPLIGGANTRANDSQGFAAGHGLLAANDRFAIDDFDGDLAPDIAIVQPVSSNSSGTKYIVQLQFGSGQRRSICLAAHWRDVRIVARDVNGDRIPNLILSSAWSEEPYAVLTNEGNSAFHRLIHLQLKHSLGNLSRVSIGPQPRPVGNSCDISIVWRTGLRENEMYWGHLLDEAFCLSTQFDLSPLSFACVPAWARPTETRSGPRLIRVSQNWPMPTSFGVIVLLTELLQAQIQIEVYHVSEGSKAFDNEDLGVVFGDS